MASLARAIITALKSAAQVNHGAGFDLSAADAVKIGEYFHPPTQSGPFVWISPDSLTSTADSVQLGRYGRTLVCTVTGYIGASSNDPESRVLNALDLMHYVWTAMEDLIRGGNLAGTPDIIDVVLQGTAFAGDLVNLPSMGIFSSTVTVTYQATRGF